MSVSASIKIHLSKRIGDLRSCIEIIKMLRDFGWIFSSSKYIGYLSLGDKDNFDWQEKEISIEALTNILKAKEEANEVIGIIMTWKNTEVGGEFLFWPDDRYETFSINLSSNRQTIGLYNDHKITDFQWYLRRIFPPLNNIWMVEYFEFSEHL